MEVFFSFGLFSKGERGISGFSRDPMDSPKNKKVQSSSPHLHRRCRKPIKTATEPAPTIPPERTKSQRLSCCTAPAKRADRCRNCPRVLQYSDPPNQSAGSVPDSPKSPRIPREQAPSGPPSNETDSKTQGRESPLCNQRRRPKPRCAES